MPTRLCPPSVWTCFSARPFFRLCPLGYAHSLIFFGYAHFSSVLLAMPFFFIWICFSARPFFRLCPLGYAHSLIFFGYAHFSFEVIFRLCLLFGYAHFSFEVVFGYAFFRLCPQLCFIFVFLFSAPVCQSLKCDWRWGEVFLCFHGICAYFRHVYNFQVCNVRKKKQKLHTSALCVYEGVGGPPLGTHNAGV